jgi:hypothetical protein
VGCIVNTVEITREIPCVGIKLVIYQQVTSLKNLDFGQEQHSCRLMEYPYILQKIV